jgi:predicted dehydrogenase
MRFGVIGLGYWGPNLTRVISSLPQTELAGICDLDETRLATQAQLYPAAKATTSLSEILEDPSIDAVAVATPVSSHFAVAKGALTAGKHVLVEKPLARTVIEADELVKLAAKTHRVLMVDHVFIYSPAVQKLAQLHRESVLGELRFIDSVRINLGLVQQDVNVIWDLAPHDLSIFDYVLGRGPLSVLAAARVGPGADLATLAHLHLDYGQGLVASVHVNWLSPVKIRHLLIGGSRRSVLYNDLDQSEPLKLYDRGVDVAESPEDKRRVFVSYRAGDVVSPKIEKVEPLRNLVTHFCDCIETGIPPLSDGRSGRRMVQVLEAADLSLEKGGIFVDIPGD